MQHYPPLNFEDNLPFGKYRGESVAEICEDDPRYLFWMFNNTDLQFSEEVVKYVESRIRD